MIAQEFSFSEIPAADRLLVLQSPHPSRKEVFCRDNSLANKGGMRNEFGKGKKGFARAWHEEV